MSPALQRCQRLLEYIQLVVESRQLRLKRLHRQPLGMELLDQDLELGDERRRQLCELLKGLQQPGHGRRDRLRQGPHSPPPHRPDAPPPPAPTRLATAPVRATNSSIAACSKPFRCVSPSSAIATALVRHPFGPDPIIAPDAVSGRTPRPFWVSKENDNQGSRALVAGLLMPLSRGVLQATTAPLCPQVVIVHDDRDGRTVLRPGPGVWMAQRARLS